MKNLSMKNKYRLLDEDFLLAHFGSREVAVSVLEVYLEEEPAMLEPLMEALEKGFTAETLDADAHRFKGSLDLIGVVELSALAESICKSGRSVELDAAKKDLDKLCQELHRLRDEISDYVA